MDERNEKTIAIERKRMEKLEKIVVESLDEKIAKKHSESVAADQKMYEDITRSYSESKCKK